MIVDMISNKKLNPMITKLFIRGKKLHISHVFITHFILLFQNILNLTHYFVMKIPNKRKLQQTVYNYSSDIDFKDFMNLHKKCTAYSDCI